MRWCNFLLALTFISKVILFVDTAKILAIFPFPGPSQTICVQRYLKTLAERGHELTVVTAYPQKKQLKNYRDVPVLEVFNNYEDLIGDISGEKPSFFEELDLFIDFFYNITERVWENKNFQKLLHSNERFDLIIFEALNMESLYGLAHHYKAPLIGYSTYGTDYYIDGLVGNPSPLSYTPVVTTSFTDHMNFQQRLSNFLRCAIGALYIPKKYYPLQQKLFNKYFPQYNIDLAELRKNFSLVFLNQHYTLSFPRPYVPNMIEVGGAHISYEPSPLPAGIDEFIKGAKHGVIYFSLGSNIKSKNLPSEKIQVLLRTFAELPQRVLWKFEDPELPGKPNNVMISKWFPQPDILAHPNVKVFITHGGQLSTTESIFHGKPIVGIPFFYDQFLNVRRAENAGFGITVDFGTLNENDFKVSLERIINDPHFAKAAAEISKRFHDQPMKPLDKAIFWTEYVLRHRGAPFMRNAGQDLSFIEYHNLDVYSFLLTSVFVIIILIIFVIYVLIKLLCGRKETVQGKRKLQ